MLDVRQLEVLRQVGRSGSFAAAARVLGCSPQAVAQQIAKLESESSAPLVTRTRSGAVLTPAGESLARRADRVLTELDRARAELRDPADAQRTVWVGSFRSAWYHTDLAVEFARRTGIALSPAAVDPPEGLRELLSGRLDGLLAYDLDLMPSRRYGQLRYVELLREPSWVAFGPDDPLAETDVVDLRDLRHRRWLALPKGHPLHAYLLAVCRSAGFEPRIVQTATGADLLDPLRRTVGITLCAASVEPTDSVVTRPLAQSFVRTLYAAWRPDHPAAAELALLPGIARDLYVSYVESHVTRYAAWLREHPDALLLPGGGAGRDIRGQ